jgi:hypothetical protein
VIGAVVLGVSGPGAYVAAWVLLIVGVHFLPLARLFANAGLRVAGVAVIAVAIAAAITGGGQRRAAEHGGGRRRRCGPARVRRGAALAGVPRQPCARAGLSGCSSVFAAAGPDD